MAIRQIFKISLKTFFNPKAWLGYNALKQHNQTLWSILKSMFVIPAPHREETFIAAMKRQRLSESDVQAAARNYRWYAWLFFILGICVFIFGFYLLFRHGTFSGWLLATAASALLLGQAFKYDFWVFQIKKRKLGCTFTEWKNSKLKWK